MKLAVHLQLTAPDLLYISEQAAFLTCRAGKKRKGMKPAPLANIVPSTDSLRRDEVPHLLYYT